MVIHQSGLGSAIQGGLTLLLAAALGLPMFAGAASDAGKDRVHVRSAVAPAPEAQSPADVLVKSEGCLSCHAESDSATMHSSPAVMLGCVDCHGGNAEATLSDKSLPRDSDQYLRVIEQAHPIPYYKDAWGFPSSANPKQSYTLLNKENPEYIRFINPGDYRVAREACGACHLPIIEAAERSLMATSAMFWAAAAYNNGVLPNKRPLFGESYTPDGKAAKLLGPVALPAEVRDAKGIVDFLLPLPAWEIVPPGDIFRVFERGGRNITSLFPETGNPSFTGQLQRIEEPGRPDFRQSNRGPGTGARVSIPVLNLTKTRLNDPHTWFLGTNDQPGDYRSSGCSACHVIYANDRDPRHSASYGALGNKGESASKDPTIPRGESGHPIAHVFTRAIPTSQCMSCHMHQPNMFVNSYLGYTMWDYEADAQAMWPEQQVYPTESEKREVYKRNPEGAAPRGKWADLEFLEGVSELNPTLKDTQFADYHGHGWNFRAVFKRDRAGNLLDADGAEVAADDPEKFDKAVHMSSIHLDAGMHCVDCHYAQDTHGNGHIYGEVAAAVEIDCKDCHGTITAYPTLKTSGPAALVKGTDMAAIRNPDGSKRFQWVNGELIQRSVLTEGLEWKVSLVKDSVDKTHPSYNEKSARAKSMSKDTSSQSWGEPLAAAELAHSDDEMECYACHTSWTTSCAGCHLPIEANQKTEKLHYDGGESRNYATYNPQVSRDQMFLLGRRELAKGGKIAPVRSTSALVLSSSNANREVIYTQQPPISSSGYSSQAFNPHFAHTVRKTETKTCEDCHLSKNNDNNAIMSQLLMYGTGFVNFLGHNAYVGGVEDISAVTVTEWTEPQAVKGSYLQRYAYPDYYAEHLARGLELTAAGHHDGGRVQCLQLRGEYLFVAEGAKGTRVYDVASIANKGVSQKIISAPFSLLGQDIQIESKNASCAVLPTNQPIQPSRNTGDLMRYTNLEQPFHPMYQYLYITDAEEGLILVDIDTLMDGDPRNNNLSRALTWNEGGVLAGARHLVFGGRYAYLVTNSGLVILNMDDPLAPRLVSRLPLVDAHSVALQFRYLFVTDAQGLKVIDVTNPATPVLIGNNTVALTSARRIHLARTYAYVAAGDEGIAIVDIENPASMQLLEKYAEGLSDAHDVTVASTNASLFAYVADGEEGLKVFQLMSPDSQPNFYGFSPKPSPELIARYKTPSSALALSRGLERDRGVDETGGQIAVFGRIGSRPLNEAEMKRLYLDDDGKPWFVEN